MATSSISKNFVISGEKQLLRISELDESDAQTMSAYLSLSLSFLATYRPTSLHPVSFSPSFVDHKLVSQTIFIPEML